MTFLVNENVFAVGFKSQPVGIFKITYRVCDSILISMTSRSNKTLRGRRDEEREKILILST